MREKDKTPALTGAREKVLTGEPVSQTEKTICKNDEKTVQKAT